jgi:Zinc knuckle
LSIKEKKGSEGSGSGHSYSQESGRGNGKEKKLYQKFDKSRIKCFNCSKHGHFASECRQPKKEKAFIAEKGDDEPVLLMLETCELMENKAETTDVVTLMEENIQLHLGVKEKDDWNIWYLDTGASNHMTGCKEQFTELNTSIRGIVKFDDGSTVSIGGCGTVLIEGRTSEHKALTEVYYIPKLTSNIISLGQLEERGCKVMKEDGYLRVFDRKGHFVRPFFAPLTALKKELDDELREKDTEIPLSVHWGIFV